jgi:hypothetical protein
MNQLQYYFVCKSSELNVLSSIDNETIYYELISIIFRVTGRIEWTRDISCRSNVRKLEQKNMIFTLKINNSITCLKTPFFHHVSCNGGNHFVCTFYTGGGGKKCLTTEQKLNFLTMYLYIGTY